MVGGCIYGTLCLPYIVKFLLTMGRLALYVFFFFNDTATTEIYTLSLHDALPISVRRGQKSAFASPLWKCPYTDRSEEHTSELQSPCNLVCRLLLEKKDHRRHAAGEQRLAGGQVTCD